MLALVGWTIALAVTAMVSSADPPTRLPGPRFATVNGAKLHYLDWGGNGEALLFLTSSAVRRKIFSRSRSTSEIVSTFSA